MAYRPKEMSYTTVMKYPRRLLKRYSNFEVGVARGIYLETARALLRTEQNFESV